MSEFNLIFFVWEPHIRAWVGYSLNWVNYGYKNMTECIARSYNFAVLCFMISTNVLLRSLFKPSQITRNYIKTLWHLPLKAFKCISVFFKPTATLNFHIHEKSFALQLTANVNHWNSLLKSISAEFVVHTYLDFFSTARFLFKWNSFRWQL